MIFDTHVHLSEYSEIDFRFDYILSVITQKEDFDKHQIFIKNYKNIYGAIGLHPLHIQNGLIDIKNLILKHSNSKYCIAIGEIGLDKRLPNLEKQINIFKEQLNIASDLNLPVILHCIHLHDLMISILRKYSLSGIIHSFNGSFQQAYFYQKLNFKIGINKYIFNDKAIKFRKMLSSISLSNIVLETDAPFMIQVFDIYSLLEKINYVLDMNVEDTIFKNSMEVLNVNNRI